MSNDPNAQVPPPSVPSPEQRREVFTSQYPGEPGTRTRNSTRGDYIGVSEQETDCLCFVFKVLFLFAFIVAFVVLSIHWQAFEFPFNFVFAFYYYVLVWPLSQLASLLTYIYHWPESNTWGLAFSVVAGLGIFGGLYLLVAWIFDVADEWFSFDRINLAGSFATILLFPAGLGLLWLIGDFVVNVIVVLMYSG